MRKKLSPWAHSELTTVVTAPGPMITAQSRLGEVTAQSRQGHSSVTARSQLSHGEVTAQSRHLQHDHGSVTARSQLNHGPGHGSVTAGCDHFGHRELTVSSRWAHGEQSRWPIFFSWAALEVMTGCATEVGVSVQSTCCTCTGAGAGNLRGVAIKPGYLGCPTGVPRIWGVPGAKAGHTWHCCCWKIDDIIRHIAEAMVTASWTCWPGAPATAVGAEIQGTQDPYACGSNLRNKLRRLYHEVAILPLLLREVITRYLLCGFAGFSADCVVSPLQTIGSRGRHHANRDLLLYILSPSSYTTFAAIESSPGQMFWVRAKSLWLGTADTLGTCYIAVYNFGLPSWVGVDLDSWLPAAWQLPAGLALVIAPAAFTGGVSRSHVTLSVPIWVNSLVLSSVAEQTSVWVSDETALTVSKLNELSLVRVKCRPNGSPGRSIPTSRPKGATVEIQFSDDLALRSLSIVAGSPKGDSPAGQDSWSPVGPVCMAGVPSELRVYSSWVWFSEDPALKILSMVAWTRQRTGPTGLDIKLSVTSFCEEEAPSELWVRFAVDRLPEELAPTKPAFAVDQSSQHAAPAECFCSPGQRRRPSTTRVFSRPAPIILVTVTLIPETRVRTVPAATPLSVHLPTSSSFPPCGVLLGTFSGWRVHIHVPVSWWWPGNLHNGLESAGAWFTPAGIQAFLFSGIRQHRYRIHGTHRTVSCRCCLILFLCLNPSFLITLTQCGLVMPYGDIDLGQHWFR